VAWLAQHTSGIRQFLLEKGPAREGISYMASTSMSSRCSSGLENRGEGEALEHPSEAYEAVETAAAGEAVEYQTQGLIIERHYY
jgi:hypothetical protein